MSDEWGPWIEHEASQELRAVIGDIIDFSWYAGGVMQNRFEIYFKQSTQSSWRNVIDVYLATSPRLVKVRYRVRKPKGMAVLADILAEIPDTTKREVAQ